MWTLGNSELFQLSVFLVKEPYPSLSPQWSYTNIVQRLFYLFLFSKLLLLTLALASFKKVYFNILSTKSLKVAGKVLYETVESKMQNSCVLLLAVQHFKSKISDDNPLTYLGSVRVHPQFWKATFQTWGWTWTNL